MFCRKCGVHLKGNERFCPRCGAEIATGANVIWEQNAYGNTNAPVVKEADVSIKASKSDKKPNLKNRKKKRTAKIVIPVLLIVVLAMCFVGIFVGIYCLNILDENKKAEETDIAQSSSTVNIDGQSENTWSTSMTDSEDGQSENILLNPMRDSSGNVTYDCVWFGSYPQSDATGEKKDPIKWRVLSINENDAFLMADCNLDCQQYNTTYWSVTWKMSTIRSWLNGYNARYNENGIDYSSNNFIDKAFTSAEQDAIKKVTVVNHDNPDYGTDAGKNTEDKIYLLSIEEVINPEYGFSANFYDMSRKRKNTAYAATRGTGLGEDSNDMWWLRSPGCDTSNAATVDSYGYVSAYGNGVGYDNNAVCPALHLNLSSDVWSYAGTVCTDGTVDETPIAKTLASE